MNTTDGKPGRSRNHEKRHKRLRRLAEGSPMSINVPATRRIPHQLFNGRLQLRAFFKRDSSLSPTIVPNVPAALAKAPQMFAGQKSALNVRGIT